MAKNKITIIWNENLKNKKIPAIIYCADSLIEIYKHVLLLGQLKIFRYTNYVG